MIEFTVFIVGFFAMLIGIINFLESDRLMRRFGYHVKSVKETQETWEFANRFFGVMLVSTGAVALVVGILLNSYMRILSPFEILLVNVVELVGIAVVSILSTEIRVKQLFDERGNRK